MLKRLSPDRKIRTLIIYTQIVYADWKRSYDSESTKILVVGVFELVCGCWRRNVFGAQALVVEIASMFLSRSNRVVLPWLRFNARASADPARRFIRRVSM